MVQEFTFKPQGVCSREMKVTYEGDTILSLEVIGGCRGNLRGIAALVKGMKIEEVIKRLDGIECHDGTSCPDQLAQGLKRLLK